ncbi:hypothetical protein GQ472_01645 [archaeon]|nr:hypothetical protein [archaeon]
MVRRFKSEAQRKAVMSKISEKESPSYIPIFKKALAEHIRQKKKIIAVVRSSDVRDMLVENILHTPEMQALINEDFVRIEYQESDGRVFRESIPRRLLSRTTDELIDSGAKYVDVIR